MSADRPSASCRRVEPETCAFHSTTAPAWRTRLHRRFGREVWNIGIVPQSFEDIVRHGITKSVQWWMDPGPWRMLADPSAAIRLDDGCFIFAEHLDHRIGRGELWAAHLPADRPLADTVLKPWMKSAGHLSYPRPVIDTDGRLFFMAESWQAGALHLWREEHGKLIHLGPIINEPLLDPTPWHDGTAWWLFCTSHRGCSNSQLHLFRADRLQGPWTPHARNPVKSDAASSRPAGPISRIDGMPIRPVQDCSETYGGAVVLNKITRLDQHDFAEVPVRRLQPDFAYPNGLHTLCPVGDATLVDGKRLLFNWWDVPRKLLVVIMERLRPSLKPSVPACLPLPG